jgi:hypothetical protein
MALTMNITAKVCINSPERLAVVQSFGFGKMDGFNES